MCVGVEGIPCATEVGTAETQHGYGAHRPHFGARKIKMCFESHFLLLHVLDL